MDVNVSGIDCVKLQKEGDDLLLDSGHQSAHKPGYTYELHGMRGNTQQYPNLYALRNFTKRTTKCPQVDAYYKKPLTQPSPHWDRCAYTTIQHYKSSRDYQTPWLAVSVTSCGYALIFFNAPAEPDQKSRGGSKWASTTTSINLSPGFETSGIFSENPILLVIMQLILAICVRIA